MPQPRPSLPSFAPSLGSPLKKRTAVTRQLPQVPTQQERIDDLSFKAVKRSKPEDSSFARTLLDTQTNRRTLARESTHRAPADRSGRATCLQDGQADPY